MHQIPVPIAQELDFDVPCALNELLDKDVLAAEGGLRFALGLLEGIFKFGWFSDHPHAPTAAAMCGL
jgi:hypothetical protein